MATPKQEYRAALRDIAQRFGSLEEGTLKRALTMLRQMRERLQLELTSAEGWNEARIQQLIAAVDRHVAQYEAQLIGLSNTSLRDSARLGALSVVEPLQAAGVTGIGFFDPTPAQLNVLLDFSADLIRNIGQETRRMVNTEIRLAALGERSSIQAMQAITAKLGTQQGRGRLTTGVSYRAERILRTEMGRVYNVANSSQQQETAKQVDGLQKQWLATGDGRTRLAHLAAHGQIVDVDDPFIVGGEELMYPLDPNGSAGNTINCRCRMATVHPEIGPVGGPLDARVAREKQRRQNDR